jgi:hypothetical protein
VVRMSIYQNACEEIFFKEQKIVFDFCFNQLVGRGVPKLFKVEGDGLTWETASGSMKVT